MNYDYKEILKQLKRINKRLTLIEKAVTKNTDENLLQEKEKETFKIPSDEETRNKLLRTVFKVKLD